MGIIRGHTGQARYFHLGGVLVVAFAATCTAAIP